MRLSRGIVLTTLAMLGYLGSAQAGVLPEDRADVLYHLYDGGGVGHLVRFCFYKQDAVLEEAVSRLRAHFK